MCGQVVLMWVDGRERLFLLLLVVLNAGRLLLRLRRRRLRRHRALPRGRPIGGRRKRRGRVQQLDDHVLETRLARLHVGDAQARLGHRLQRRGARHARPPRSPPPPPPPCPPPPPRPPPPREAPAPR